MKKYARNIIFYFAYNNNQEGIFMQNENKSKHCNFPDGKKLNILAAAFANVISDNFNNEELAVLSLFFSVVSDSLTTIRFP